MRQTGSRFDVLTFRATLRARRPRSTAATASPRSPGPVPAAHPQGALSGPERLRCQHPQHREPSVARATAPPVLIVSALHSQRC